MKIAEVLKKPSVALPLIILIGGALYFILGVNSNGTPEFIIAKKDDLVREIKVTGNVEPAESVDLAFEKSGRVAAVYKNVGEKAYYGETLVVLESSDLIAQKNQAEADVKAEEAKLEELRLGTREEEIEVAETKVINAKTALRNAKLNAVDAVKNAYLKTDDALRYYTDQLFINPRGTNPQIVFTLANANLKGDIEWGRLTEENLLKEWKELLNELNEESDLVFYINDAKDRLSKTKSFLDDIAYAVNYITPDASVAQTTIDGWRADISTARFNVNTAANNVTSAEEKLNGAESNLALTKKELALKEAGTLEEQIKAQEARLEKARTTVAYYQAQIAKNIIRAPISGIVTVQNAKVGEIVSANAAATSIISEAQFEIEANISEVDIANIKVGNSAFATLDAYGNDVNFDATVTEIDPAETIVNGIITYKTTLQFKEKDSRIKSGMTANVRIILDTRENVIVVPESVIISKDGKKFVKILKDGGSISEVEVKIDLIGREGVEIINGIEEGDKVVTSLEI